MNSGVIFEYYCGIWDQLPDFDALHPYHVGIVSDIAIDYDTEKSLKTGALVDIPENEGNFGVRFRCHIKIEQSGLYQFSLSSNDGSRLKINTDPEHSSAFNCILDNDGCHYVAEKKLEIYLETGTYPLQVEYFHKNGKLLEFTFRSGPYLELDLLSPGFFWFSNQVKTKINSNCLFYQTSDFERVKFKLFKSPHYISRQLQELCKEYEMKTNCLEEAIECLQNQKDATIEALKRQLNTEKEKSSLLFSLLEDSHFFTNGNAWRRSCFWDSEQSSKAYRGLSGISLRDSQLSSKIRTKSTTFLNQQPINCMSNSENGNRRLTMVSQTSEASFESLESNPLSLAYSSDFDESIEEWTDHRISEILTEKEKNTVNGYFADLENMKKLYFFSVVLAVKLDQLGTKKTQQKRNSKIFNQVWFQLWPSEAPQIEHDIFLPKVSDVHDLLEWLLDHEIAVDHWPIYIQLFLSED